MSLSDVLDSLPKFKNDEILKSFIKSYKIINDIQYDNILCSISGGSDSDVMLDIVYRVDESKKVKYVWFDTGVEYQATKNHLKYLENKYNIEIIRVRAYEPIPLSVHKRGEPFLSKFVSEMLERLQRYNFKWEDKPYEELIKEYPKCKLAVKWWTNNNGKDSHFNINRNKYLKEFLVENPPTFKISNKCCYYSKKKTVEKVLKEYDIMLDIVGIRKSEGGLRSVAYKNCYTTDTKVHQYRPLFWFNDETKQVYERVFNIKHSECYTKMGLGRTGCVCCPFGKNLEYELSQSQMYEPKLYNAVTNIFKNSYAYTRQYREFIKNMKTKKYNKLF